MEFYFFDSSALVKNYIIETGSNWVQNILNETAQNAIYVVSITKVEVVSAFSRRSKMYQTLDNPALRSYQKFKADFVSSFRPIGVDNSLIELAVAVTERHALRGYDSIQLAGAISLSQDLSSLNLPPTTFVSADEELNSAAISEGFKVINPNDHEIITSKL